MNQHAEDAIRSAVQILPFDLFLRKGKRHVMGLSKGSGVEYSQVVIHH
jgi:hypothetical protein